MSQCDGSLSIHSDILMIHDTIILTSVCWLHLCGFSRASLWVKTSRRCKARLKTDPWETPAVEQLWLMSFLKVDQTLMQIRGNWSKGILNHLMRGKLIWKVSFSLLFYPAGSHGRTLHNKRAACPDPASLWTPSWTKDGVCKSKFGSEADSRFT